MKSAISSTNYREGKEVMKNRKLAIMAVTALLTIGSAMSAFAGQWQQDEKGWRYQNDDGSYIAQDGKEYKTEDGYRVIDGTFFERKIYQFDINGYMVTGWIFDQYDVAQMDPKEVPYFMEDTHGYGGYWNYYRPDGSLVQFDYTPDGYWMDASGCWDFQPANPTAAAAYAAEQEAKRIAAEERNNASNNPTSIEQQEIPEDGFNYEYAEEVLELVNEAREDAGVEPLEMVDELNSVAEIRAKELITKFSHLRPDGTLPDTAFDDRNYVTVGENIAKGVATPEGVMRNWMNSKGHKKNILDTDYDTIGIACYVENGTTYWVQFFGWSK